MLAAGGLLCFLAHKPKQAEASRMQPFFHIQHFFFVNSRLSQNDSSPHPSHQAAVGQEVMMDKDHNSFKNKFMGPMVRTRTNIHFIMHNEFIFHSKYMTLVSSAWPMYLIYSLLSALGPEEEYSTLDRSSDNEFSDDEVLKMLRQRARSYREQLQ